MFVKVCGLSTNAQIDKAIEYGYDAIGVVTCTRSKRHIPPDSAIKLAEHAKGRIKTFVVGLSYSDVEEAAPVFDYTQIYEARQIPNLALASKEMPPAGLKYEFFVFDASIGSGVFQEFPEWIKTASDRLMVAGGLNSSNVCNVIRQIRPFAIDVSSGVETNGVKDFSKMKSFIDTVRNCPAQSKI